MEISDSDYSLSLPWNVFVRMAHSTKAPGLVFQRVGAFVVYVPTRKTSPSDARHAHGWRALVCESARSIHT